MHNRIMSLSPPEVEGPPLSTDASEVLVTSTVRDLVAASGIAFEDRGVHDRTGVPDRCQLLQLVSI